MTNYSSWDAKATALCKAAEDEDKEEEAQNNEALGLTQGPTGPPVAKAEKELKELSGHSDDRNKFIAWSKDRETVISHEKGEVSLEGEGFDGKAIRIQRSRGVNYILPPSSKVLKVMLDDCRDVRFHIQATLLTSTVELYQCQHLDLELDLPLGTLQVDECNEAIRVRFSESDHLGRIYHQNSPGLSVAFGSTADSKFETIGLARAAQLCTRLQNGRLETTGVRRGEGEFPVDLPSGGSDAVTSEQPEPEAETAAEERTRQAELKRAAGNDMFRSNDFAQAAALYTLALEMDPSQDAVWANRAQCWLKLGQHEKALADSIKCTEVQPSNPKGWFRKGMSLHAMARYPEAIPALLEAEKLEPSNKQVQDAIKMAQLMARKAAN